MNNRLIQNMTFLMAFAPAEPLMAFDISIGPLKVCDTCGGGVVGGTSVDLRRWEGTDFINEIAEAARDGLLKQAALNLNQFNENIKREYQKAIDIALSTKDKALIDTVSNLAKTANDIVDAANATARFADSQIKSSQEILSNSDARLRDGKVVDAIWHISTDSWQHTNKNAAQAAQESEIVKAAGQAVATAYGGPAGAAAYASWLTYNSTNGNLDLALKAGVYAYAMQTGYLDASKIPTNTIDGVAKKAAMMGAMGGAAVAASGGNSKEILDGFVKSGGAVVVQAGQSYVKANFEDTASTRMDSYCMTIANKACAEAKEYYSKAKDRVDEIRRMKVQGPTVKVTANGQWALSWVRDAIANPSENQPAVVLTYVGDGSPFSNTLTELAAIGDKKKFGKTWIAYRDVGASSTFFGAGEYVVPQVGAVITARIDVNLRSGPAKWDGQFGVLKAGSKVAVLEVRTLQGKGKPQEWLRVQRLD